MIPFKPKREKQLNLSIITNEDAGGVIKWATGKDEFEIIDIYKLKGRADIEFRMKGEKIHRFIVLTNYGVKCCDFHIEVDVDSLLDTQCWKDIVKRCLDAETKGKGSKSHKP